MKLYNKYEKIINLVITFVIIMVITIVIKNYFKPFFLILILTFLTNPIYKLFLNFNFSKSLCGLLSVILVNLVFFILIFYFGNNLLGLFYKFYKNNIVSLSYFLNNIKALLNLDITKTLQSFSNLFNSDIIMRGAILTTDGIISYFLANIISYFILTDKDNIYKIANKLFPRSIVKDIFIKSNNLREVLKIELKLIILSSLIIIFGFKILRIPNSIFLGFLCAILDILPFVGTTIVFIPIIIYNIIIKRYILVVGIVLVYLLERISREILEAKFLSNKLEIHPAIVILSIYIGVNMFGLIGIIAGPIYSIIAKDLIFND